MASSPARDTSTAEVPDAADKAGRVTNRLTALMYSLSDKGSYSRD